MRLSCILYIFLFCIGIIFAEDIDTKHPPSKGHPSHPSHDVNQHIRRREIILDINAKVLGEDQSELLRSETYKETTISGRPVEIKLVVANVVVVVQFTPYIRRKILVVQGQVWINLPEQGTHYYTSLQTIPLEFNEPILFFPLGQISHDTANIEVELTLKQHED